MNVRSLAAARVPRADEPSRDDAYRTLFQPAPTNERYNPHIRTEAAPRHADLNEVARLIRGDADKDRPVGR